MFGVFVRCLLGWRITNGNWLLFSYQQDLSHNRRFAHVCPKYHEYPFSEKWWTKQQRRTFRSTFFTVQPLGIQTAFWQLWASRLQFARAARCHHAQHLGPEDLALDSRADATRPLHDHLGSHGWRPTSFSMFFCYLLFFCRSFWLVCLMAFCFLLGFWMFLSFPLVGFWRFLMACDFWVVLITYDGLWRSGFWLVSLMGLILWIWSLKRNTCWSAIYMIWRNSRTEFGRSGSIGCDRFTQSHHHQPLSSSL